MVVGVLESCGVHVKDLNPGVSGDVDSFVDWFCRFVQDTLFSVFVLGDYGQPLDGFSRFSRISQDGAHFIKN